MNPQTPDNEVANPRWIVNMSEDGHHYLWDNRKYDNYDLRSLCRILNEYEEKTNEVARLREENADLKQWLNERYKALSEADDEVARLRELLASSIAINKKWVPRDYTDYRKVEDIEQEARLAPAPEEQITLNNTEINAQ